MTTTTDPYRPEQLPAAIRTYLDGHDAQDHDGAAAAFTADAVVVDDGSTYRGRAEIRAWLGHTSTEYIYTTEHIGQQEVGDGEWLVVNHLEGDFPGGTVDLTFRFVLADGLVRSLTIAP
ncbi:nuclear transport factor 2 family protein [Cellulomonas hominis]